MKPISSLVVVAILLCAIMMSVAAGPQKVLLVAIKALTLKKGQYTTGRRSSVLQTNCIGGACHAAPATIQCQNQGSDGIDVQWECKADLGSSYRFGSTTVVCEGYDYPDDPYVLAGSCGVEFTIDPTDDGHRPQYNQYGSGGGGYNSYNTHHSYGDSGFFSKILNVLFIGAIVFVILRVCFAAPMGAGAGAGPGTGFGPGFGGGYGGGGGGGYGGGPGCPPPSQGPGFWTGLGLGGFLGNMFSRPTRPFYGSGYSGYSSGGFGGGGGGFGGGMMGGGGGSRMTSGFGGTRRR